MMKRQENTKREKVSQQNTQLDNFALGVRFIKRMSLNNLKKEPKVSTIMQAKKDRQAMAHVVYSKTCRSEKTCIPSSL